MNNKQFKHTKHTLDISDKHLVTYIDTDILVVEQSELNAIGITSYKSDNLIYDLIKVYSPKSNKSYTFIHNPSDIVMNGEEILVWIFKCEYAEIKTELHILND